MNRPPASETARSFIQRDLDDGIELIADVRRLMPPARLDTALTSEMNDQLSRAEAALKAARSRLLETGGGAS